MAVIPLNASAATLWVGVSNADQDGAGRDGGEVAVKHAVVYPQGGDPPNRGQGLGDGGGQGDLGALHPGAVGQKRAPRPAKLKPLGGGESLAWRVA